MKKQDDTLSLLGYAALAALFIYMMFLEDPDGGIQKGGNTNYSPTPKPSRAKSIPVIDPVLREQVRKLLTPKVKVLPVIEEKEQEVEPCIKEFDPVIILN